MVRIEDLFLFKMGKEVEVNGNVVVVEKIGWLVGFSIILFFCNVDILCL